MSSCKGFLGFDSWMGKISWRRKWQSTPVFLPGESQGQKRSLAGHKSGVHWVARVRHNLADDVISFLLNVFKNTIQFYVYVHLFCTKYVCSVRHPVMSNCLQAHWLYPVRFLCLWNSPGENSGVGCHSILQGIVPTLGSNPSLLHCRQILYHLSHQGKSQSVCNHVHICCWFYEWLFRKSRFIFLHLKQSECEYNWGSCWFFVCSFKILLLNFL